MNPSPKKKTATMGYSASKLLRRSPSLFERGSYWLTMFLSRAHNVLDIYACVNIYTPGELWHKRYCESQWDSLEIAYIEFRNFINIFELDIFRDIIWPKEKVLRSI